MSTPQIFTWKFRSENGEDEIHSTENLDIENVAEEIAEYLESQGAKYSEERRIEIWCPKQNRWRKMDVDCESVRTYSAMESIE